MPTIQLIHLAHARSGDKGDTANVGVIALRPEFYPLLVEALTLGDPHRFRLELKGFPAQEFVQSFARPDPEPLKIALKR